MYRVTAGAMVPESAPILAGDRAAKAREADVEPRLSMNVKYRGQTYPVTGEEKQMLNQDSR